MKAQRGAVALLDLDPMRKRTGGKELVLIDRSACPVCASPTTEQTLAEPALFYFGGYGAMRRSTSVHCTALHCHWAMVTEITEANPRTAV